METNVNNVFFHENITKESIKDMTRKNVDIIPAIKELIGPNPIPGLAIVSIDDDEIVEIINHINQSLEYYIAGEDDIRLGNTTITISALIVDKI